MVTKIINARMRIESAKNPLMLRVKMLEIMSYSHEVMKQFPKSEKYQLVSSIKESERTAMHLIIGMEKKYAKKTSLQNIDIELEYLRDLIRLAYQCQYINTRRRHVWIGHIDEAGRILGGLVKYFSQSSR
jgi:hypothetical protein